MVVYGRGLAGVEWCPRGSGRKSSDKTEGLPANRPQGKAMKRLLIAIVLLVACASTSKPWVRRDGSAADIEQGSIDRFECWDGVDVTKINAQNAGWA